MCIQGTPGNGIHGAQQLSVKVYVEEDLYVQLRFRTVTRQQTVIKAAVHHSTLTL